ncbi:MAG: hypothetical protein AAGC96_08215, partial [Pseudomonadota bacterium]
MAQFTLLIACLIIVPLIVHLRRCRPATLFIAAALVLMVLAGVSFIERQLGARTVEISGSIYTMDGPQVPLNLGLAMAFVAGLVWLQQVGAMRYPGLTKALFWPFYLGIV